MSTTVPVNTFLLYSLWQDKLADKLLEKEYEDKIRNSFDNVYFDTETHQPIAKYYIYRKIKTPDITEIYWPARRRRRRNLAVCLRARSLPAEVPGTVI